METIKAIKIERTLKGTNQKKFLEKFWRKPTRKGLSASGKVGNFRIELDRRGSCYSSAKLFSGWV